MRRTKGKPPSPFHHPRTPGRSCPSGRVLSDVLPSGISDLALRVALVQGYLRVLALGSGCGGACASRRSCPPHCASKRRSHLVSSACRCRAPASMAPRFFSVSCSAARVFSAGSWYTSGGSARRAACSLAASSSSMRVLLSTSSTAASDRGISVSERVLDEKQSATLIRRQVRLNWRQHSAFSDCSPFARPESPPSKRTSNWLNTNRSKSSSRSSRSKQRKRGERRGSRRAIRPE
mmetsp:Transcript_27634/g.70005  ORF Transcript_27634/g.70005 Transcript_27634/m.70005 type:complete len:235 (+) Transcript_27634:175-879(+)